MNVSFSFELDQLVKVTATGFVGVITMLAYDDGGKKYYVQGTPGEGQWWVERLLTPVSN